MLSDSSSLTPLAGHPLATLPREDLDLIVQLVLKSGSLKDLAAVHDVSYPTIRARLDRVIDRLAAAVAGKAPDPMSDLLATLMERGELSPGSARAIRDLHRREALRPVRTAADPHTPIPGEPS